MTKKEFLSRLSARLAGLPAHELAERLDFYAEMIDDRMEEGFTEAEAVAAVGDMDEIVSQILSETPLVTLAREKIKPRHRLATWEIVLLAVGSPIWAALLIAAIAVLFSLAVTAFAVILSLFVTVWACFAACAGAALGGLFAGAVQLVRGYAAAGFATMGASLISAGAAILLFFGALGLTKSGARGSKRFLLWLKSRFIGKETKR